MPKEYLGDSVYCDFDGYHIVLTTENGYGANNTIYLEPSVLQRLNRYYTGIVAASKQGLVMAETEAAKERD